MTKWTNSFRKSGMAKRLLSLCLALAMLVALVPVTTQSTHAAQAGDTLYLKPNSNWTQAGARFAAYFYGTGTAWVDATDSDGDGYYEVTIPTGGHTSVIFCRMNPAAAENNWDNKWNQTGDLSIPDDGTNCYTVAEGTWGDSGTWSVYTPASDDPTDPPAATYIVAGNNAAVFGTQWDPANTANAMTLNTASGLYEKTYAKVPICNLEFKVTDGTWSNCWGDPNSTGNYAVSVAAISDVTIKFNEETKAITVDVDPTGEAMEPVTEVTVHYRNTGAWTTVNGYAWDVVSGAVCNGAWPGSELTENAEHSNWYTLTLTGLNAAGGIGVIFNNGTDQTSSISITADGEYWYDGGLFTEAPASWENGTVVLVDYTVKLHFANLCNWGSVYLYTWGAYSTGGWPGVLTAQDADGFYSVELNYQAAAGQGLSFIFSGGSQTVDLALAASDFVNNQAEKWVVPTTTDSTGKYYADIVASPDAIAISPVVSGTTVTFAYKGNTTDTVELRGSMNGWSSGYTMTPNAYGVFKVTLENVSSGIHTYKFVVNGSWILDPLNSWVETEADGNQNSAFLISNPELDDNTVTLNVHYSRADGVYDNWNVHAWSLHFANQFDFNDDHVATVEVDGRQTPYISFIIRKSVGSNKWVSQLAQQSIDLSEILSGTIDMYVTVNADDTLTVYQTRSEDLVVGNKISSVNLDYDENTITVTTGSAVKDPKTAFAIYYTNPVTGKATKKNIIGQVTATGSSYTLTLTQALDLVTLYQYSLRFSEQVKFTDYDYAIGIVGVYASDKFAAEFTYTGGDLGATYSASETVFKVWAPTAESVSLKLYATGSDAEAGAEDLVAYEMTKGEKGVWSVRILGDLKNLYYTYSVTVDGKTAEACDPYARTTGVNGSRAMVVDLDSTDPAGWDADTNPNPLTSYTDAVIYELHVRDFSIDESSGVSEANRGKFLALTETGTTTAKGVSTGLDHLKELGITHLHLLPIYDYATVDETTCDSFNWGYDPMNYNVPEGSYSTNPYDGNVRVNEMKQMVQGLHENGISVIMDVVYNHVYDAGTFSYNVIVPGYFSRQNADGSYSNGSGCGNDTASERAMVRDYIVDSVMYWKEEYHIDGFRFDLVGLLDAATINEIVNTVHEKYPDVIFYGEGWTMGTAVEAGTIMATQANSAQTPEFAYFSDTIRNLLAGSNGSSTGFVSGSVGRELEVADNFMARTWWSSNPNQIVQYASCHDNYTLVDKLILSTGKSALDSDIIKMNNLAAAVYLTSQGVPFIHAGEDFLREKLEEDGGRCENSYNSPDAVNRLQWSNLEKSDYASTSAYYQGLIAFRKAHPALRLSSTADISANVTTLQASGNLVAMKINGGINGEIADGIVVIFNANSSAKTVTLPEGTWKICVQGNTAGTASLGEVSGSVSVPGISAMILVQGSTEPSQDYYLFGYINGANYGCEDDYQNMGEYKFVNGKLTTTFTQTSYVGVKTTDNGTWYMTKGWAGEVTSVTLYDSSELGTGANKLMVPADVEVTFTLVENADGTLTLSYTTGSTEPSQDYYLFGYINGANYGCEDDYQNMGEYKFVGGKLTTTFTQTSYVGVKTTDNGAWYMTKGWAGEVTSVTLYDSSELGTDANKLMVPADVEVTFTLVENADGTLTLSYTLGGAQGNAEDYYLFGYINRENYGVGSDFANLGEYKFDENGKLTTSFVADSYVGVKNGDLSEWYFTDGWLGSVHSATLYNSDFFPEINKDTLDKLFVPGGVEVTFSLTVNEDHTVTLSYEADTLFIEDASGIQDGVTLQAWNWSFAEIEKNMALIAKQGYTAVQTSPIQPTKEATLNRGVGTNWWVYYQPVDFVINTESGNALGTKTEFISMVETAHKYGIKVIVDVVANHLANESGNDLSSAIPSHLRNTAFWHDYTQNTTAEEYNTGNRYGITQKCMSGLPDLNTANKELQGYVLDFLKECIDAGVDGFRFDATKHIETPEDDASIASDFWPTVVGGAEEYAMTTRGIDLYCYGELLDEPGGMLPICAYTKYLAVTDNSWGNTLTAGVAAGNAAALNAGYNKVADPAQLIIWTESHDTFANDDGISRNTAEEDIIKSWALVAARADAMGLYFARPESLTQELGVASLTGWSDEKVQAANLFHNAFAGEGEVVSHEGGIAYIERGNAGVVLVNTQGGEVAVNVTAHAMADGTYTDQISKTTFTVADGKITGTIGSSGIAVVYNVQEYTDEALTFYATSVSLEDKVIFTALANNSVLSAYDSYYVEFVNLDSTDERMSIYKLDAGAAYGSKYTLFQFPIYVCQMTDRIEATLYGVKNGVTYKGQSVIQTVESFALKLAGSMKAGSALQKMTINMLQYGAMMQVNFGYRLDHLANDELGEYADLVVTTVPTATNSYSVSNYGRTGASWKGHALSIGSSVQLQYMFALSSGISAEGISVEVTVDGVSHSIPASELVAVGSYYAVVFEDLLPTQADALVTVTVYNANGKAISETITDTLASNVAAYQTSGNANLRNAVNAMLNYYRLAKEAYK